MSTAVALAIVLGSAGPIPVMPQRADLAELVRDACVETGMRRAEFERLAQTRRWRQVRTTSDSSPPGSWNLVYRAGDARVMLSQIPDVHAGDPSIGSICTVAVERAASLGLGDEAPVADLPPGYVPMRIWSRLGDRTLTYAAAPDGRATISLSRQIVTSQTDVVVQD